MPRLIGVLGAFWVASGALANGLVMPLVPPLPAVAPQTREEMDYGLPRGGERSERHLDREGRVLRERELPANRQPGTSGMQDSVKKTK